MGRDVVSRQLVVLKVLLLVDAGLPALEVKDRGGVLMVGIVCEKHRASLHVIGQSVVDWLRGEIANDEVLVAS